MKESSKSSFRKYGTRSCAVISRPCLQDIGRMQIFGTNRVGVWEIENFDYDGCAPIQQCGGFGGDGS